MSWDRSGRALQVLCEILAFMLMEREAIERSEQRGDMSRFALSRTALAPTLNKLQEAKDRGGDSGRQMP